LYVLSTFKYHTWQTGCKKNVSILLNLSDTLMKAYRQDGGQKNTSQWSWLVSVDLQG
jgi:hypothetical protein